jgi:predicted nucleic acid-binding protein
VAVALDASVVVGFLDGSDELHKAADREIREILRDHQLVVSVVTYAEVLTGACLGHHDEGRVRGFFEELISRVIPVDTAVADVAAGLRARSRSLAMPDALIAATAELDPEVQLLVSGDRGVAKLEGLGCPVHLVAGQRADRGLSRSS